MTWVVASAHGLMVPLCQIHSGYCVSVARDSVEQAFCLIAGGGRGGEQEREWGIGAWERQRGSLAVARREDWAAETYTARWAERGLGKEVGGTVCLCGWRSK